MEGNARCTMMVVLSILVLGDCAPALDSGAYQILQHLGLATGGSLPQITQGERIRPDDSPIYYIKLPPVPHYFLNNNIYQPSTYTTSNPFEKVAIDFTSNGRPDQIYHWNKGSTTSDYWNRPISSSSNQWRPSTTSTTTTTTTTPAPTTTTTTTPKPVKKPWLTLDKYFPYNGRPSSIYIWKPKPTINPNKYKHRYFSHFNY